MTSNLNGFQQKHALLWFVAGYLALIAIDVRGVTEDRLHKSFHVAPGGKLVMDVRVGGIEVTGTKGDAVTIDAFRRVTVLDSHKNPDERKEQELLGANELSFRQDGSTVTIVTANKRSPGFSHHGTINMDFRFLISVPENFNLDLKTSGGGIAVEHLAGDVKSETSGGGLKFTEVRGPVHGHTSGGGIKLKDCEGRGSIETSGGSILIANHKGDVTAHTSGAGIKVERVQGELDAETSGGSISAVLQSELSRDWRLSTSGGGISVRLPETAKLDIDAETSAGSVHTELPITMTGKEERNKLRGKLNGGGASLVLRTSAGSIYLKKLENEEPASTDLK